MPNDETINSYSSVLCELPPIPENRIVTISLANGNIKKVEELTRGELLHLCKYLILTSGD